MRDDRGASAVLIAILLPALLLGMGALVITIGGWYVARGMDQNAADAAVIAVARSCLDEGVCQRSAADPYIEGATNGALAGRAHVVCGSVEHPADFGECPASIEDGRTCPPKPDNGLDYVTVFVAPENVDGTPTMDNWFSAGDQKVGACAQAALGAPVSGTGVAVTMSKCEWDLNTAGGNTFAEPPDVPAYPFTITERRKAVAYQTDPDDSATNFYVDNEIEYPTGTADIAGSETVISPAMKDEALVGCSGDGQTSPGNFDWLAKDACELPISGPTYEGVTGNDTAPCEDVFWESRDSGTPIYIPVYNSVDRSGANAEYDLGGFAAFVVTGWHIGEGNAGDWKTHGKVVESVLGLDQGVDNADYCAKPNKGGLAGKKPGNCVYGYFTEALVTDGSLTGGGGVDLGLKHAFLTG